ncbi:MAG TPA: NADH-quinone oxidoreductase subunit NuoH [Longimicrobiales bacterium]|nr:NADH-quinone oxidoreductase subunit NuoH [Longimicrobiales bacterium]
MHELGALSDTAFLITSTVKVLVAFLVTLVVVALWTLAERRFSAFIQDRLGPNRVGPWGLLQPAADGLKNLLKEETLPGESSRFYFVLAPMLAIAPAFLLMAVIPFASPLPTPWGVVDMIIADVPIGILFILAFSSLGVYGLFLAGWSSNNKYAFLGGLRASAQMVSYEVSLGMSLIPIFMLAGNVTLPNVVWMQQEGLGIWFAFPLGLAFFLFTISAFAETNRLPFDMPEAEAELVAGYHAEYSSMKFSMFMIGEYAHLLTQSALMATLFFGGWDIPFWQGDDMRVIAPGIVEGAEPAWWKSLLTFFSFAAKTLFFAFVFIWVRWTLPRFRYDQIMDLGWKAMLPTALAYIMLMGGAILALDSLGVPFGLGYGLILTAVNLVAMAVFLFVIDNDRVLAGASARRDMPRREDDEDDVVVVEPDRPAETTGAGV